MSLIDQKITQAQMSANGIVSAPDKLTGSAAENKAMFDKLVKNIVAEQFNTVVDTLVAPTGAAEIGSTVEGMSGETIQAVLAALKALRDSDSSGQGATNQSVQEALGNRYTKTQADALLALKCDVTAANALVKTIEFDGDSGVFTITTQGGGVTTIDTLLEKVPATFSLEGNKLVLTLEDGTRQEADISAFIDTYTFSDSDTVDFTQTGKSIGAAVKDGSITIPKLDPEVRSGLEGFALRAETAEEGAQSAKTATEAARDLAQGAAATAGQKAAEASGSASAASASRTAADEAKTAAAESADQAKASTVEAAGHEQLTISYAVGGTGTRPGEDTDNAKYYKDQAGQIVGGDFATKLDVANAKDAATATAAADATTKADAAQTAAADDATAKSNAAESNAKAASIPLTQKGVASGVATLDADGKVVQLPSMSYDLLGSAATALQTAQNELAVHTMDASIHVTTYDKTAWSGKSEKATMVAVALPAASWVGEEAPFTQGVTIPGLTAAIQVNLSPDEGVLAQMLEDGTAALLVKNSDGVATAVAMGEKPAVDLTVQADLSEVKS